MVAGGVGRARVRERERESVLRGRQPWGRPGQSARLAPGAADGSGGDGPWGGRGSSRGTATGTGPGAPAPPGPTAAAPAGARPHSHVAHVRRRREGKGCETRTPRSHWTHGHCAVRPDPARPWGCHPTGSARAGRGASGRLHAAGLPRFAARPPAPPPAGRPGRRLGPDAICAAAAIARPTERGKEAAGEAGSGAAGSPVVRLSFGERH